MKEQNITESRKPEKVEPRYSVVYILEGKHLDMRYRGYKEIVKVNPAQFDRAIDVLMTPISECPYHELFFAQGHDDSITVYDRGNGLILVTNRGRSIKDIGFAGFNDEGLERTIKELGLPPKQK